MEASVVRPRRFLAIYGLTCVDGHIGSHRWPNPYEAPHAANPGGSDG
jgi:hypothetical protein